MIGRLFEFANAFEHPVTLWISIATASVVVTALLLVLVLFKAGILGKAQGKELTQRCVTWVVLLPLLFGPILACAAFTMVMVLVLSLLCFREYSRVTGLFRERTISGMVVVGILLMTFSIVDNWYRLFVALFPLMVVLIAATATAADRPEGAMTFLI